MNDNVLFSAGDLNVQFGRQSVLKNLNLDIKVGEKILNFNLTLFSLLNLTLFSYNLKVQLIEFHWAFFDFGYRLLLI